MKRLLASAALVLVLTPATALADLAGRYTVTGTNFNGTPYAGTVVVKPTSDSTYEVVWTTGAKKEVSNGIGMQHSNAFAAGYVLGDAVGLVVYEIKPDGSLIGRWTIANQNGVGTETWTPAR